VTFLIATNDRGDVVGLTNTAGAWFARYTYDPYGRVLSQTTQAAGAVTATLASQIATRQVLRYASYAYDAHSAAYYLSARHYDPASARFLTKDPARDDGEESAYQYCGGDPVGKVDPTGMRSVAVRSSSKSGRLAVNSGAVEYWLSVGWEWDGGSVLKVHWTVSWRTSNGKPRVLPSAKLRDQTGTWRTVTLSAPRQGISRPGSTIRGASVVRASGWVKSASVVILAFGNNMSRGTPLTATVGLGPTNPFGSARANALRWCH